MQSNNSATIFPAWMALWQAFERRWLREFWRNWAMQMWWMAWPGYRSKKPLTSCLNEAARHAAAFTFLPCCIDNSKITSIGMWIPSQGLVVEFKLDKLNERNKDGTTIGLWWTCKKQRHWTSLVSLEVLDKGTGSSPLPQQAIGGPHCLRRSKWCNDALMASSQLLKYSVWRLVRQILVLYMMFISFLSLKKYVSWSRSMTHASWRICVSVHRRRRDTFASKQADCEGKSDGTWVWGFHGALLKGKPMRAVRPDTAWL